MDEKNYVVPELEFVGDASKVVLGVMSIGPDPGAQMMINEMEFAED